MGKPKATCKDIKNMVKILKEHKAKPDKDGYLHFPIDGNISLESSPLYRDSVGGEEMGE